ncbi:MAG: hypothetical protein Q9M20_01760 [Mariprofundaceae bacterium]|nr:hypothetical protein [Mariprofundaceae bacterium]
MTRRFITIVLFVTWLSACASGHKTNMPTIENPYLQHLHDFTHVGVEAMQQEKWPVAIQVFEKALNMAKLINEPATLIRSWYNVSMAYKAASKMQKAEASLQQTLSLAQLHHVLADEIRAKLQLNLIHFAQDRQFEEVPALPTGLAADIYLMAGKLAYLQHHEQHSKQRYALAIRASGEDRVGLSSQAKALLGLAQLAKRETDAQLAKNYALKVLRICHQIGEPRLSAHASLLLAGLPHGLSQQEALDYARRAKNIYVLLHDKYGQKKAEMLLQKLIKSSQIFR